MMGQKSHGPNPQVSSALSSYMIYVSEEGIDLDAFVTHGGRLAGREDPVALARDLTHLCEKIETLHKQHPRLAAQLQFLADFIAAGATEAPETVRNEATFALLYATKEEDMIPDALPDIGYCDDAAVTEIVLYRHAEFFEQHCFDRGIDWNALRLGGDTMNRPHSGRSGN